MVKTRSAANQKSGGKKTVGKGPRPSKVKKQAVKITEEQNRYGVKIRGLASAKNADGQTEGVLAEAPPATLFPNFKKKLRSGGSSLSMTDLTGPVRKEKGSQPSEFPGKTTKDMLPRDADHAKEESSSHGPSPVPLSLEEEPGTQTISPSINENSRNSDLLESLLENSELPQEGAVERLMSIEKGREKDATGTKGIESLIEATEKENCPIKGSDCEISAGKQDDTPSKEQNNGHITTNEECSKTVDAVRTEDEITKKKMDMEVSKMVEKEASKNESEREALEVTKLDDLEISHVRNREEDVVPKDAADVVQDVLTSLKGKIDEEESLAAILAAEKKRKKKHSEGSQIKETQKKKLKVEQESAARKRKGKKSMLPSRQLADEEIDEHSYEEVIIKEVKSIVGQKIAKNVPLVATDNISFHSVDVANRWRYVFRRVIFPKKELAAETLGLPIILELLERSQLLKTVTRIGVHYPQIVKEFVANLPQAFDCPQDREY